VQVGDLIFDASILRYGIIVASKEWYPIGAEESEWEHEILYDDGSLDTAYERELEVIQ
tara:strand:- start:10587 stop:10760 length:174 start_codon:yes stop_codon:yes gene_type:complete